jgi:hypothetical protein
MPPLGTAPRRISPGIWATRSGRLLSAAGAAYWEHHFRQGNTDGLGHVSRPAIPTKAAAAQLPASQAAQAAAFAAARGPQAKPGRPESAYPQKPTSAVAAAAQQGDRQAQAQIQRYHLHRQALEYAKQSFDPGAHMTPAQEMALAQFGPASTWGGRFREGLARDIAGIPMGGVELVRHPEQTVKAIGKSYLSMAEHPVRMAKQDPATMLFNLLPAYGATGKLALLGLAAKGAEAGALSRAAAVGKAAIRPSPVQLRTLTHGGASYELPTGELVHHPPVTVARFASRNPLTAAIQRRFDINQLRRLDGGFGPKLNVFSPEAAAGRELGRQLQGREARAMAPADAFDRFDKGKNALSASEQKAFEIIARGHTPETFVQGHHNALTRAGESGDETALANHQAHRDLSILAAEHVRNPSPKLQAAIEEGRALIHEREANMGMTPAERNLSLGARHDEIQALAEGRRSLRQRQTDLEVETGGPRPDKSRAEIQAELDKLQAVHGVRTQTAAPQPQSLTRHLQDLGFTDEQITKGLSAAGRMQSLYQRDPERFASYVARAAGKMQRGQGGIMHKVPGAKSSQHAFGLAVRQALDQAGGGPTVAAYEAAGIKPQSALARMPTEGHAAGVEKPLNTLRARQSQLRTQLDVHDLHDQIDALKQQQIAIGQRVHDAGGFYTPFRSETTRPLVNPPPAIRRAGGGPPRVPRQKQLTGRAQRQASYRTDIVKLISDSYRQSARIRLAREYWPKQLALSKPTIEEAGGTRYARPVRTTTQITPEFRQALTETRKGVIPEAELARLPDEQAQTLREWINPRLDQVDPETNTVKNDPAHTVRYVDSRLVGGLLPKTRPAPIRIGGREFTIGDVLDTINAAPKVATLAKPGYLLNRVQQFLQNASQQGVFMPINGRFVKRLQEDLTPVEQAKWRAMAGVGRARQLEAEGGWGIAKKAVHGTAEFLGRVTDDASRSLALAHEMRRAGFNTPEKVKAALNSTDEATQTTLDGIAQRANYEAIPFGKMSEVEKRTISRALFFYPWTRAAIEWSARFPVEHPFQASVAGNLGQQGSAETQRLLGNLPTWARGLVPLTGGPRPLTINLANLNTPQTAVDTAEMLASLSKNPRAAQVGETPEQNLGPLWAAGLGFLTGTVRGRGHYNRFEALARGFGGSLPEISWYEKMKAKPTSVYPSQGFARSVGSAFLGQAMPRVTSKAALGEAAQKDVLAALPPGRRLLHTAVQYRTELLDAAKRAGVVPEDATKLPEQLRVALNARTMRFSNYHSMGIKTNRNPDFQRQAFKADVALLRRKGLIDKNKEQFYLDWVNKIPDTLAGKETIEKGRREFTDDYFMGGVLSDARSELRDKGVLTKDPFGA